MKLESTRGSWKQRQNKDHSTGIKIFPTEFMFSVSTRSFQLHACRSFFTPTAPGSVGMISCWHWNGNDLKILSICGCLFTHSNTTISTWSSVHSIQSIQDFDNEDHSKLLSSLQVETTALSLVWSVVNGLFILGFSRKPLKHGILIFLWNYDARSLAPSSALQCHHQLSGAMKVPLKCVLPLAVYCYFLSKIDLVSPPRLVDENYFSSKWILD